MISVMISNWMGARIRAGEMMGSLVGGSVDDSYCIHATTMKLCHYVTMKSNRVKNRDHIACLWLSLLADFTYSR